MYYDYCDPRWRNGPSYHPQGSVESGTAQWDRTYTVTSVSSKSGGGGGGNMYKSYRNPSDIDSQVSLPRSYTLPREFKYKKPKSRKAIRTEHFIHSTNSSDGKAAPPFVDNQEMNITYISLFSPLFRWRWFSRRQRRGRHTGFGYAAFPTAPPTRASVRLRQPQSNAIAFQRLGFAQSTRNEALKYKQPTGRLFHFCNTRRNYPNREKPIKLCREMLTFRLRVVQDLFLCWLSPTFPPQLVPSPITPEIYLPAVVLYFFVY